MTISFVPSRLATLAFFRDAELDELRRLAQEHRLLSEVDRERL